MEEFLIRGWVLILPACGGTSALARVETLTARWLHEPYSISYRPERLEFLNTAGRYRSGRSPFSSPGCRSCSDVKGLLIWGWELIVPGCGGTSSLARGAILAAR